MHVRELQELYPEPRPHFNTLSTFVRLLEDKGYLDHKAVKASSYQYFPTLSREEFHRKTLRGVINKYFNSSYLGLVSSLVEEEEISVDELKELIRQVEENAEKQ